MYSVLSVLTLSWYFFRTSWVFLILSQFCPKKSTSSAYATSFGIFSSNEDVGLGSVSRTSLRACSKYKVNRTGLQLSPCGVPTLLVNGFDVEVPFILVSITVSLRRNFISLVFIFVDN